MARKVKLELPKKQDELVKDRWSPIWDYSRKRKVRIAMGKQIGEELYQRRMVRMYVYLKEEDVKKFENGEPIELILQADQLIEILNFA